MSIVTSALLLGSLSAVASADEPDYVDKDADLVYSCNAQAKLGSLTLLNINFDMDATINAKVPAELKPNQQFDAKDASITVSVPADEVNVMRGILGWSAITGTATLFEVHSSNLLHTINAADTPIPIPVTPVPPSGDLVFTVPQNGIDVGRFTAGPSGTVTLSAGDISTVFERGNNDGLQFVTLQANCTPNGDSTLVDIQIVP